MKLTELHERLAAPVVVAASALIPHTGVMRLGVFVFHPSGLSRDGDYIKNDGKKQEKRQDPPAPGVRDATAEHDEKRWCVHYSRGSSSFVCSPVVASL